MTLTERLPGTAEPDAVFDAFQTWVSDIKKPSAGGQQVVRPDVVGEQVAQRHQGHPAGDGAGLGDAREGRA